MNSYVFDKRINLNEDVKKVSSVVLNNDFNYLKLSNGVRVTGKIGISGECKCEDHSFPFKDTMDVDLIVPNENIGDVNSIKLVIDNYDLHIVDEGLTLKVRCSLNGYEEATKMFELEKTLKENFKNIDDNIVQGLRDEIGEDDEKKFMDLINGKNVDVISNLDTYEEVKEDDIPLEVEDSNNDKVIDNTIKGDNKSEEVTLIDNIPTNNNPLPNDLFVEERFVIFSSFYRVRNGDTYESIASKNNIDVQKLKDLNKNKELTEGSLIQIPR